MLWVGGGIMLHGVHELGWHLLYDWGHAVEAAVTGASGALGGLLGWLSYAVYSALIGLGLGAIIVFVLHKVLKVGHAPGAH